jgi:primosomal protein N' (replication factor Y)
VAVLSTDTSLRIPDFRAAERTFQLLTQVAGRSGRGDSPGEVYIQTYYPNHYSVRLARSQDYRRFYEQEIFYRRQMRYPPYSRLVFIGIKDARLERVTSIAGKVGEMLREEINRKGLNRSFRVLGPAPALLEKIKDEYRHSLLIRCLNSDGLYELLLEFREKCALARLPLRRISIDVDPIDLM